MINITVSRALYWLGYSAAISLLELCRAVIKKDAYHFQEVSMGISSALVCAFLMP